MMRHFLTLYSISVILVSAEEEMSARTKLLLESLENARKSRIEQIEAALTKANQNYANEILKLEKRFTDEQQEEILEKEKEVVRSLWAVVPNEFKISTKLGQLSTLKGIEGRGQKLIGTRWHVWRNADFFGEALEASFIDQKTIRIDDKDYSWKYEDDKLTISYLGSYELSFSNDEFVGQGKPRTWEKLSMRLITNEPD